MARAWDKHRVAEREGTPLDSRWILSYIALAPCWLSSVGSPSLGLVFYWVLRPLGKSVKGKRGEEVLKRDQRSTRTGIPGSDTRREYEVQARRDRSSLVPPTEYSLAPN